MTELMNIKQPGEIYYSGVLDTLDAKKIVANAMSSPDYQVADYVGKIINLVDVFVEFIDMENQETGDIVATPRVVLFDDNGKSFSCVSFGMFNSIKRILTVFGEPKEWTEPLGIEIRQIQKGKDKRIYTLYVV